MRTQLHPEAKVSLRSVMRGPTPRQGYRDFLEVTQPQTGALEGYEVAAEYELVDGRLLWASTLIRPVGKMPAWDDMNADTRRAMRLDAVDRIAVECLPRLGEEGLPWLHAFLARKKRPGAVGKPLIFHAEIAKKRVIAEEQAPRGALRYMVQTWPDDFFTESAAKSKVNKAKSAGMLQTVDGRLQLTTAAIEELTNKEQRGQR